MTTRPLLPSFLIGAALAFGAIDARAQAVTVIAHPSVVLDADEIRDLYVGDKQFAGGVKLVPVDNLAAQRGFLAALLRLEPVKYATLWAKKSFRDGLTAPATKSSDAEVLAFVQATPGAIGYVNAGAVNVRQVRVLGPQ